MTKAELAVQYQKSGMNCAQSVACAFQEELGVDQQTLLKLTQNFGLGIGRTMEGTCGAITGATIVLSLSDKDKIQKMKATGDLVRSFKEKNKAVTCKELKGIETGVMLRSCQGCVEDAATFLESVL